MKLFALTVDQNLRRYLELTVDNKWLTGAIRIVWSLIGLIGVQKSTTLSFCGSQKNLKRVCGFRRLTGSLKLRKEFIFVWNLWNSLISKISTFHRSESIHKSVLLINVQTYYVFTMFSQTDYKRIPETNIFDIPKSN